MKTLLFMLLSAIVLAVGACEREKEEKISIPPTRIQPTDTQGADLDPPTFDDLKRIERMHTETMAKMEDMHADMENVLFELKNISGILMEMNDNISSGRLTVLAKNPKFSITDKKDFLRRKLEGLVSKHKSRIDNADALSPETMIQRLEIERHQLEMYERMLAALLPIDNKKDFEKLTSKWFHQRWEKEMLNEWKNR